jgi:hypothetical protein
VSDDALTSAARRAGAIVPEDIKALAVGLEGEPEAVVAELRRTKPQHFGTPRLSDAEFAQAMADGTLADVINGELPATATTPPQRVRSIDQGAQGSSSGLPRTGDSLDAELRGMTDHEFMFQLRSGYLTRRLGGR